MRENVAVELPDLSRWIVCQIGAREHYALPRALHRVGLLRALVTDAWPPPGSAFRLLPGRIGERIRGRYDEGLSDARVVHFTSGLVRRELANAARSRRGRWDILMERNAWFQEQVVRHLLQSASLKRNGGRPHVVLAYSYAARSILAFARDAGAITVLGQIDGGAGDEQYMKAIWARHAATSPPPAFAPARYWDNWRAECRLADFIVVNSLWSRQLLLDAGIEKQKIAVVPVLYQRQEDNGAIDRQYPEAFSSSRPLRVLFLGSLNIRKGVLEALVAAEQLRGEPIEFWFVGDDSDGLGRMATPMPNVRWIGAVPRSIVGNWYGNADVFLFPTHSDGFGMTQLEAQDWGLPVVASKHCGHVVEHGRTGVILTEVTGPAIVDCLRRLLARPQDLAAMAREAPNRCRRFDQSAVLPILLESLARAVRAAGIIRKVRNS